MKTIEGSFGSGGHSYRASVSVGIPYATSHRVELRFAGSGKGSRGVRLTPSKARILAYALLAEAEALTDNEKSN